MTTHVCRVVAADGAGSRLDAWLAAHFPASTRARCREAILSGQVSVNGAVCRNKARRLAAGEEVFVAELAEEADNRPAADATVPFAVLFEDDALVAVNKPAGIPVQPLSRLETGTLTNGLVARWPEIAEAGDLPLLGGVLHRIDTWTSGLVLAARTRAVFDAMRAQFAAHSCVKVYYALVEGNVAIPGTLVHDLAHDPTVPYCRMVDAATLGRVERPLHAETSFVPEQWVGRWTLLRVTIRTGVTHQIRCQLALNGTPIVGDALYGRARIGSDRHFLHAHSMSFRHPVSGEPCRIESPLPADFHELLAN